MEIHDSAKARVPIDNGARLRVTEIFYSLQGETRTVGLPTVFVRLTGCPLRCGYCDTPYAFQGGEWMSYAQILSTVNDYAPRYVTVTGGEPLAQPGCILLLRQLCDAGYEVSLETSGAMDIREVDPRVVVVMDLKTPGSGESERNLYDNLALLRPKDQVKFVICDRDDYDWACYTVRQYELDQRCEVLFSPEHENMPAVQLADWVLADGIPVRVQIQLHKYLWGNVQGH